jgi:hypothetical protein
MARLVLALVLAIVGALVVPSPALAAPPAIHHFNATVSATNLLTLDWQVSGGTRTNLLYIYDAGFQDVGFRQVACPAQQAQGCSTSFRVTRAGTYRYTLSVRNDAMEFANQRAEVTVAAPAAPTAPRRVHVDMLAPTDQTLTWSTPGSGLPGTHYVQLTQPGSLSPIGWNGVTGTQFPLTGSYTVPASSLPVSGEANWSVAHCVQPVAGQAALCSTPTTTGFVVEPAQIAGGFRRSLPAGQATTLSWAGAGNWWYVSAPSLGIGQWRATPSITLPAGSMTAGVHDVEVTSCIFGGACSNRSDTKAPIAGTVTFTAAEGALVLGPTAVATLTPNGGGAPLTLSTTRSGTFHRAVPDLRYPLI